AELDAKANRPAPFRRIASHSPQGSYPTKSVRKSPPIPFFSQGFRPFFLMAALWAAISMGIWITYWAGGMALTGPLLPLDWHVHELVFGYGGAVLCGFLLTAIPNWTRRPPLSGLPLAALALIWLAARIGFL
ncbi:NnrS family protein, partial [Pseudomonas aeruginosa]|uniref:NnrS family protein n=1 Tax=Pseudomonas aeruginosa TaxID=287 RepID=UPI0011BE4276